MQENPQAAIWGKIVCYRRNAINNSSGLLGDSFKMAFLSDLKVGTFQRKYFKKEQFLQTQFLYFLNVKDLPRRNIFNCVFNLVNPKIIDFIIIYLAIVQFELVMKIGAFLEIQKRDIIKQLFLFPNVTRNI